MNSSSVAREEAVKREVNEAIEDGLWPDEREGTIRVRCECGSTDCIAFVNIQVPAYEQVRDHGRRFVLALGHQDPKVENVVAATGNYVVVEKIGQAGEVAERLDPREGDAEDPSVPERLDPRGGAAEDPTV